MTLRSLNALLFACMVSSSIVVNADPGGSTGKSLLPKCITALERLVNISNMSAEDQLMILGPYRSTEIKLDDGNHYSVAVDTQGKLRLVRRNAEQLSTSLPIELDATTAKELSTRSITPIAVGQRFMLLAQGTNGQGSIIELLPTSKGLRKSQIQRVAKFNNRPDAENTARGVWHAEGVSELGNFTLNYFYEVREKKFGGTSGVEDRLIGKVLHLNNDRSSSVSVSSDKLLFSTDKNASALHLLTPQNGVHHVAFAKPLQDVLVNGQTMKMGSVEVHELDISSFSGGSKLHNELKFKARTQDGAIKSIYFVQSNRSTHEQVYVVVVLENAAYAGRLYSDAMMSRVDINVQHYVQSFGKILSQENFSQKSSSSAFNPETVGLSKYDKPGLREDQIIIGDGPDAKVAKLFENFSNPKIEDLFLNNKLNIKIIPKGDVHVGRATYYNSMAESVAQKATKEELKQLRREENPEAQLQFAKQLITKHSKIGADSRDLEGVAHALVSQQNLIHFVRQAEFGYRQ